jgi:hypothetical protein
MTSFLKSLSLVEPAILLALFVAGSLAGRALALPVPPSVVGLALVLLGCRLGVMAAAVEEQPGVPRLAERGANARHTGLRAANG